MADSDNAHDSNTNHLITSRNRIDDILKLLSEKKPPLDIELSNSYYTYNSAILKSDINNNIIIIDLLDPDDGNTLINESDNIIIETHLDGVDVKFTTSLSTSRDYEEFNHHVLVFPSQLIYLQRRETFRAQAVPVLNIAVTMNSQAGSKCPGVLYDISPNGMCIQLAEGEELPDEFKNSEIDCDIHLPDNIRVSCKFKITHADYRNSKNLHTGGRFIHLAGTHHRAISRLVFELQRKNIRT